MIMTFLHSGARGDIIYGLPAIKALGGGILYIKLDAKHYKSRPMDLKDLEMFRELLAGQDYIEDVKKWEYDAYIDCDLDKFRETVKPCQLLSEAHLTRFNLNFDLSQPWLDILGTHVADIVVNRSERYHGAFDWGELTPWQDKCIFIGLKSEHDRFIEATGLMHVPYYGECTYHKLAEIIAGSKLFVGNQSFAYSLAEAMKHPRVLEVCPICPNCLPTSSNGFTRLTQNVLRHYLLGESLIKEHSMNYCLPIVGMKMRSMVKTARPNITYVVVNAKQDLTPFVTEALHRDKSQVLWNDEEGDYRNIANTLAKQAQGKVICVVNMEKINDYDKIRPIAELLVNCEGIAGMYLKQSESLMLSDACFAVSRKAYEECGLFNLAMLSGQHNLIEMVLRYGQKKHPCRSAGTVDLPVEDLNTERNLTYIRKVYGGSK